MNDLDRKDLEAGQDGDASAEAPVPEKAAVSEQTQQPQGDAESEGAQAESVEAEPEQAEAKPVEAEPEQAEAEPVEAAPEQAEAEPVEAEPEQAEAEPVEAAPEQAQAEPVEADPAGSAEGEQTAEGEEATEGEEEVPAEPERDLSHTDWYVVHTYSGYENKAKQALEERIKREELEEEFGQILIPTEEVVEMSRGKRRTSKRKFFPGYMLVQMRLTEATWYLVKSTPKITGFVGNSTRPLPVPESEMRQITSQMVEGSERLKPKIIFEKGDSVRVVDGPFINFNGTIDDVDPEKGKLSVLVSIFGRATPVEMDFVQVEKT